MKSKILGGFITLAMLGTLGFQPATDPAQAQSAPFTSLVQATGTVTVVSGFIVGANLVNGGSGYPAAPVVSVMGSSGSNAVIVAAVSADGLVTNLTINNAGSHYPGGAVLVIAPPPTNTSQSDINLNISRYLTDNLRTWTSGTNYPVGGIYTNYAGVTFYLAGFPGITNGLGTIYTGIGSFAAPKTNNFPVNITNAVTVWTLMNSQDGNLGYTNGTVDFYGSQGAHASFNIVQGFNIRDHYNGGFQNTISSNVMSLYWGANRNVRLDCQGWMLPAALFTQPLTNIQIRSFGNLPNGVPVVAAITVRTAGPAVRVKSAANQVVCYWPSTPTNYLLQTAATPAPAVWTNVMSSPAVAGNQFIVTNSSTTTNQFFRLLAIP